MEEDRDDDKKERRRMWEKSITKYIWLLNEELINEQKRIAELRKKIDEVQAQIKSHKVKMLLAAIP